MPTGYTERLVEKGQTFEEFVWRCARATAPFFHMREEDMGAPPRLRKPYLEAKERELALAKERLQKLGQMNESEIWEAARRAHAEIASGYERMNIQNAAVVERVKIMLHDVKGWTPPTPDHEGLKEFMLEQLEGEIRMNRPCEAPPPPDPKVWHTNELSRQRRLVSVYEDEIGNEIARTEYANNWMKTLAASVPAPGGLKDPKP